MDLSEAWIDVELVRPSDGPRGCMAPSLAYEMVAARQAVDRRDLSALHNAPHSSTNDLDSPLQDAKAFHLEAIRFAAGLPGDLASHRHHDRTVAASGWLGASLPVPGGAYCPIYPKLI